VIVQQFGNQEKVLHQPKLRACVSITDQVGHPGASFARFARIDQLFDGPIVHPVTLRVAALHTPFFFQRVELFPFGEEPAGATRKRRTHAFGGWRLFYQLLDGLSGMAGKGGLKMQGGITVTHNMRVFVLPNLGIANHAMSL
jgi:hypothetical protein